MTVVGLDDTDSRETGMCTTYAAHRVAQRLRRVENGGEGENGGENAVRRVLLVRLNPAVEYKTRGNAALAVHTSVAPDRAFEVATDLVDAAAETDDPRTNPGVVVAPGDPGEAPPAAADFARTAVHDHHRIADAESLLDDLGYRHRGWGDGRGRIGALAAVGAWRAFGGEDGDWTNEYIAYREEERRGTPREVDRESLFEAADRGYPGAWDTVDRVEGEAVCVPNTPGPILYGIRGDDPAAVRTVVERVESEPVTSSEVFVTNQGTDAHLRNATIPGVEPGRAYRVPGTVLTAPETREGGHVFLTVGDPEAVEESGEETTSGPPGPGSVPADHRLECVAFEPTKRFRDRVRALRPGDRITACGEVADGTLKLEKFAVRDLRDTEPAVPECPECGRSMESAGANQGYRCRDCSTTAPGKVERPVERSIEEGWYEVPPCARRHVAKPLVRGGFDAPVHPER